MTTLASLAIGANLATPAELTRDLYRELAEWLREHPALQNEDEDREAARLKLRASRTLADIEDSRKARVRPLNDQVKEINAEVAEAVSPIQSALVILNGRMTDWALAEEARRQEAAEKARLEVLAAQNRAIEALRAAQDAEDNAAMGETADVVSLAQAAVRAHNEAKKAERVFQRAERDTNVKVSPGLGGRAIGPRARTELSVTDAAAAIGAIGLTEGIAEAILTAARSYKKLKGNYPPGIAVNTTRSV